LLGDEGQDQLDGGSGDDLLAGGADNDRLTGGAGHDVLAGGAGDDWLVGDLAWTSPYAAPVAGDDTYRFNVGDGRDTVIETVGGNDRVEFAAGIAASEVTVRHVGQNLVLGIDGGADSLTLANWANGGGALVETVVFDDGTRWDEAEIKRVSLVGGTGTDQLVGYAGADTLVGNQGNDALAGGAGDDSYVFHAGDGQDGEHNDVCFAANDAVFEIRRAI
ncbi:MAG: calcium-binding protein, partial [Rhodocyclales bacterium]|nr:calcium-binding protein [Rhodocyclales bacterium]